MNNEVMKNLQENAHELVEVRPNTLPTDLDRLTGNTGSMQFYCSISDDGSRESKVSIYNAINNAKNKIDDFKGQKINVVDVVAHPVKLVEDQSGELIEALRIVLIDDKGEGYETVATGVMSSLEKLFGIVGMPSYDPPLTVIPREQKTRKGFKTLTLDLA